MNEPAITPDIIAEHGLTDEEYQRLLDFLGRAPSWTELGVVSAMWSEHCSYKSSRVWLAKLPTKGPQVIQGPGENAGVVDIGDGLAAVFKMESHNHPSFIEPYQGAATGVGGIMRDVFTMGARPVANLNALSFGSPDHPKTRHLVGGVVAGIGGYGNCMGVPTVGGETRFHADYNGNILVNAMTVGIARADRIFYAKASGVGSPVVYVGSKTGRDGIHGATMASAEFSEDAEQKRPTVQVGDPFTEKLLLEACLELMESDAIEAIQDMGAAGLTSSAVEMADKGGVGVELDLDQVPQREEGMTAYEMMLSESQERMLMVLRPGHEDQARAVFEKWGLDFSIIGRLTDSGHMVVRHTGEVVADIKVRPLVDAAPKYERPWVDPAEAAPLGKVETSETPIEALKILIGCPDLASKRWITEQYDSLVMGNTMAGPSVGLSPACDAGVVRIGDGPKALAVTSDVTPRYCKASPFEGGKQAVAEAWRNLVASGARPLAVTDNLNFGNPEKPEIMGQIVHAIKGMAEACEALSFPVVSGNVSLYNETEGQAIAPTPTIGAVGVIDDVEKAMTYHLTQDGLTLFLLGEQDEAHKDGWLGQSLYLREVKGREEGAPPPVDLAAEKKVGALVSTLIAESAISACHDVSDGGVLVAIAEMAMAGKTGVKLTSVDNAGLSFWFGEDQGRYVVATDQPKPLLEQAKAAGIAALQLGQTGGADLIMPDGSSISIEALGTIHQVWLPTYMTARPAATAGE